jgi:hypothetical protein
MNPQARIRSLPQGPCKGAFLALGAQACLGAARREG